MHHWLTFNEINNTIMFLSFSGHTSDDDYQRAYQHLHNKFVASAKAVQIGHAIDGENEIGCMICGIAWYPATCDPADILLAEHQREEGIFYCGDVQVMGEYPTYAERLWKEHNVKGNFSAGVRNEYLTYSDWGWATDDGSIHDPFRINYYRQHIQGMDRAIENGVDLRDYTTWGCIDVVSAGTGEMRKRYGLIYVDMDDEGKGTMARSRKDSFYWYKKVIASNGTDLDDSFEK